MLYISIIFDILDFRYYILYIILVLHMSPSGDEKFRCQRSTIAVGSPWGGTNGVLVHLADPRVVQMKILQEFCWQ